LVKKSSLHILAYLGVVLLLTNLNALVDFFQHPDIPYFDEEHLIVGGVTGLVTAILFGAVVLYTTMLEKQIDARRKAEEALQRANEELDQRVREQTAELVKTHQHLLHAEKLSAVGKLSASIAHEFNNPLQGIMNVLSAILDQGQANDENTKLLEMALKECQRIKKLIKQLHSFNRPSTGLVSHINLHEIIDSMLLMTREDFKTKKLSVEKKYAANMPHILGVDDQIKQVVLNLLTNAADACDGHGVIAISTEVLDKEVAIRIRDNGRGISATNLPHIFEPFFSTKPQVKGVGLGLYVSYGIVKNHRGNIAVSSTEGQGAQFTVTLPTNGLSLGTSLGLSEGVAG
jgi:signal transduction histidine kinase